MIPLAKPTKPGADEAASFLLEYVIPEYGPNGQKFQETTIILKRIL